MPWLRSGDNAATHPIVMRVWSLVQRVTTRVLERDVAVNEVFGFVTRCALQSAGHTTDYVIDEGTAYMCGGVRTDRLLELAVKAGYLTRHRGKGLVTYLLVDDPEFLHMRLRSEIDREKQRKTDNANPALTVPVRLRDGDECRYCGRIVNWSARKGAIAGTYDHRAGLGVPTTVETLVIACNACNSGRGDDPEADARYPLRPVPAEPWFSPRSAAFLLDAGHVVKVTEDLRPGSRPGNAHSDPASSGITHTPPARRAPVTRPKPGNGGAHGPPGSADSADREHSGSGFTGSGRVGSGSAGTSGTSVPTVMPAARRPKRTRRGKPTTRRNGDS